MFKKVFSRTLLFLVGIVLSPGSAVAEVFYCPFQNHTAMVNTTRGSESIFSRGEFSYFQIGSGFWTASFIGKELFFAINRKESSLMRVSLDVAGRNGATIYRGTTTCSAIEGNLSKRMVCAPKGTTARILKSAAPNDIHPDWKGESYIGTGWRIELTNALLKDGNVYLFGDVLSPRGGVVNRGIFVLAGEWDCS